MAFLKHKKESSVIYIDVSKTKRNTAGAKAPADIARICKHLGYKRFHKPIFPAEKKRIYQVAWLLSVDMYYWLKLLLIANKDSTIIYQHPSYGQRTALRMIKLIQKVKKSRFVALIHDLESLRGGIEGCIVNDEKVNQIADQQLLKQFDGVICHNEHMRQYLIDQGFEADRLVNLEIFDYLSTEKRCKEYTKSEVPTVALAGNLAIGKCRYIYDICKDDHNPGLKLNLYGIQYEDAQATPNMIYNGSYTPEELPAFVKGDFGLVWDGTSAETCEGNTGHYLRYNNPHKTSLYLSSGIPVVIWSQAAIADFIRKEGVGITVDSLYDLEEAVKAVTPEEYKAMCERTEAVAKKLRQGYYFTKAVEQFL